MGSRNRVACQSLDLVVDVEIERHLASSLLHPNRPNKARRSHFPLLYVVKSEIPGKTVALSTQDGAADFPLRRLRAEAVRAGGSSGGPGGGGQKILLD
jgi:hypothetical protein